MNLTQGDTQTHWGIQTNQNDPATQGHYIGETNKG